MRFEWDRHKAEANSRKHGIAFEEATTVFGDPWAYTFEDAYFGYDEQRFLTIGRTQAHRIVIVSHVDRGDVLRIISAREATRHEKTIYIEG
jgi:uncharacterized DUF497 family protein